VPKMRRDWRSLFTVLGSEGHIKFDEHLDFFVVAHCVSLYK